MTLIYEFTYRLVANALDKTFSKGDAIAIDMPMTVYAVIIYLAIVLAGFVVVSIADSFAAKEIATRLRVSNAKGIFTQVIFHYCKSFDQFVGFYFVDERGTWRTADVVCTGISLVFLKFDCSSDTSPALYSGFHTERREKAPFIQVKNEIFIVYFVPFFLKKEYFILFIIYFPLDIKFLIEYIIL